MNTQRNIFDVRHDFSQVSYNFAAIDFETANSERSSVCSVGIVIARELL